MRKGARVCRGEAEEKGASGAAESGLLVRLGEWWQEKGGREESGKGAAGQWVRKETVRGNGEVGDGKECVAGCGVASGVGQCGTQWAAWKGKIAWVWQKIGGESRFEFGGQ